MRGRLLHIDWNPEDTPEALHEAYRAATDSLVKQRLHALWLLRTGKRMAEVAPLLGFVYRTVQKWLAHYRQRAGLHSSGCRHASTLMNLRTLSGRIGITRSIEQQLVARSSKATLSVGG
jgi:transposase-like protein